MKSFVVELNEIARQCSNQPYRDELRLCATRLHTALEALHQCPTADAMRDSVSAWTRAQKLLDDLPPEADPDTPLSGNPEPARLAA